MFIAYINVDFSQSASELLLFNMSSLLLFFLLSSVFIVAHAKTNDSYIEYLKKEIKKEEQLKQELTDGNNQLNKTLFQLISDYEVKIHNLEVVKNVTSEAERLALEVLKELLYNLTKLENEENLLTNRLNLTRILREKYDAGLEWLTQDIDLLKARSAAGDDKKCFRLNQKPNVRGRSLYHDIVKYLEHLLHKLRIETFHLELLQDHLHQEIEHKTKWFEKRIVEIKAIIESIVEKLDEARAEAIKTEGEIEGAKTKIIKLRDEIIKEDERIVKDKKEVKIKEKQLNTFAKAAACYKKIEDEILGAQYNV